MGNSTEKSAKERSSGGASKGGKVWQINENTANEPSPMDETGEGRGHASKGKALKINGPASKSKP